MEQFIGMENGREYFRANEVTTEHNGELLFWRTPGQKWAEPLTLKIHATCPETWTATPQDSQLSKPGEVDGKLDADTKDEEGEEMCKLIEWIVFLQDLQCSGGELCQRPVNQQQFTAYDAHAGPPAKINRGIRPYLADSEQDSLMPIDPAPGTNVEKSKGDESELNTRRTYPKDRPNLDPRADQRPSKQPLHTFGDTQEALLAEPEPMDYRTAIKKKQCYTTLTY